MKKELEKLLIMIERFDPKCGDVRLSILFNVIKQLMDSGKIDMDYYNEEMEKERGN